ncbi:MAG: hypothetical protein GSR83_04685 [Desulfurococcales archaeon]|nr:hypothetical protein [Desulfurococcales archaeon]MEB3846326.1 hypothetical protein [Desulfurococcales archaeon]
MRILLEMEDKGEAWLKNSEYVKAYMFDGFLVILLRIRNAYGFSLNRAAKEIGKRIGARFVKIIDYRGRDLRYLAQQLLSPAKVHGVNIVYMPDGSTMYTIRVSKRDLHRLQVDKELLEKALSKIYGEKVSIVPETLF